MIFVNPTLPNLADFATFVYGQGVPQANLPSGILTTVTIDASGNLSASSISGTVSAGDILYGTGIPPETFILTWNGASGTVTPVPSSPVSVSSVQALSPYLGSSFDYAVGRVMSGSGMIPATLYVRAVYNLGMHQLLKDAQDVPSYTFFSDARATYKLNDFLGGVITASSDQNTAQTIQVGEPLKGLGISNLDLLKTPWGVKYAGYAMEYGPYVVGMT